MISALCAEVTSRRAGVGGAARARQRAGLGVVAAPGERLVDAPQHLGGAFGVGADHDAVGMQEVDDGRAFAQELGVRDHVEALRVDAVAVQHAANPLVGVDRHRALFHDDLVAVDGAGNLGDHGLDVGEVGGAGVALGGAHGDEDGFARARRPRPDRR